MTDVDAYKREAGYAAVDRFVESGTCIGLGTGTTAHWAIERVGERVAAGEQIVAVATSHATEELCRARGIPLVALMEREIAVAIDGADEVSPDFSLTKGGGGACFREKAVALEADRYVVIVTDEKLVEHLGGFPTPVEVVPFSAGYVGVELQRLGPQRISRRGGDVPYVTDNGNWILDCAFGRIAHPAALDGRIRTIHGVVGCGLFVGITDDVIVAGPQGVRSLTRSPG